jgi:hypothetical protein
MAQMHIFHYDHHIYNKADRHILDFKQVWSFVLSKPRQISPTNPTWHPLRIKFPTEISKIPNNSFGIKSPMKSDNEFEKIDQRSVCSHYVLYASLH